MRSALIGCVFVILAGTAHAGFSEDRIRAQLAAQGYEQIGFSSRDGQVTVQARRGRLLMTTVYDAATGELVSERVRRTGGNAAESRSAVGAGPATAGGVAAGKAAP